MTSTSTYAHYPLIVLEGPTNFALQLVESILLEKAFDTERAAKFTALLKDIGIMAGYVTGIFLPTFTQSC